MKLTGFIVARQLKKHNQPRVQSLAMRRVRIAAWQMVSCPSDAKGRRYWEESVTWRCDERWRDDYIKLSKEDYRNSTQWERPLPGRPTYWERLFTRFLGDAWIPKLKVCKTWTEWLSLTKEFEYSWHVMLNLKPPESSSVCDPAVEQSKRPRDDSDPWNVAWPSDTHRRLEVLGDNKVVINWMNGAWEVKGDEHAVLVRGVVDQLVRWFLGGTFWPRNDESDWCRHIFRESNKAADTQANWLMDKGDSGPGGQWEAPDLHDKMQRSRHILLSFDGARRRSGHGAAAWILWLRDEYGSFEKVSYGGRVLRNASAMTAEREALRMGIEYLTVLFPTEVSSFDFQVECTDRTVQYKLNAQSLRLFGLHRDVNDAHRAGANRLQNKQTMLNEANMDFRNPGLPHSVVKHAQSTSVRELIQKIENHPNRHALQSDLQQHRQFNPFSPESKKMIQEVGNIELFELLETDPKTQCTACLSYWNVRIVYCTCGHFLQREKEANRNFVIYTMDLLSLPECVIKKGRLHGHR